jgi:xylulokinase
MTHSECTTMGAAAVCAHALGLFRDWEAAIAAVNPPAARYTPNPDRMAEYEGGYRRYKQAYFSVNPR